MNYKLLFVGLVVFGPLLPELKLYSSDTNYICMQCFQFMWLAE